MSVKKFKKRAILTLLFSFFVLFSFSCASPESKTTEKSSLDPTFSVILYENADCFDFITSNMVEVKRGDDAIFKLRMKNDFIVESISRKNEVIQSTITISSDNISTITIQNIRYSLTLTANCAKAQHHVLYFPNGGSYINGGDVKEPYKASHSLKSRLRPNTELGTDKIERTGYVLCGWNTKEDCSGTHIGLGSRFTPQSKTETKLYAEWKKENPASDFVYGYVGDKIKIDSYIGSRTEVVVPKTINGHIVYAISEGAFSGCEKIVILPPTIEIVNERSFIESKIETIFFYDNIKWIGDDSFENCRDFRTVCINAIEPPKFGKNNLFSEINFADKYDILILNQQKKKVVVLGGSGSFFSVDTNQMEKRFNDSYVCINMGVNGWFNTIAQIEMISAFLKEGDVFLHIPETSSFSGLMHRITMAPEINGFSYNKFRLFACIESNYDLLSLVDFRDVEDLLTGFREFNEARREMPATSYDSYKTTIQLYGVTYENDLGYIDNRGNFAFPKPSGMALNDAGEADIIVEYIKDESAHNRLNHYYRSLRSNGIKTFFSPSPINRDTLELRLSNPELFTGENQGGYLYFARPDYLPIPNYTSVESWVVEFEKACDQYLNVDILISLSDSLFIGSDYYEPDYHLCDEATKIYTEMLCSALISRGFPESGATT